MEQNERIRVGITAGDSNGVGYEIILRAFEEPMLYELCTPVVYGNPRILTYHRKGMGLTTNFTAVNNAGEAQPDQMNMVVVDDSEVKIDLGQPTPEAGEQARKALERALEEYRQGMFDVLVTAPVNKNTIQSEAFHFPGHTEFIEERAGEGHEALMILMNEKLRVALATTHLPISQVAQAITKEGLLAKLRILNHSLLSDFSVAAPRIAVLGLNPHAGDGGLLGTEEQTTIIPALQEATEEGIQAFGPYPADGFFGTHMYEHFDAVLAMYHDQGLTAFKALAMDDGVNYTAGLPIVRTSPAHGTAYDIAGKGVASENSFRQAIYVATDILRNRRFYEEARENPLPKLYHDRREDDRRPFRDRRERTDRTEQTERSEKGETQTEEQAASNE